MWQQLMAPWRNGIAGLKRHAQAYSPQRMRWFLAGLVITAVVGVGLVGLRLKLAGYGLLGVWFFPLADYLTVCLLRRNWGWLLSELVGALAGFLLVAGTMLGCGLVWGD